jgi:hypothetical protein
LHFRCRIRLGRWLSLFAAGLLLGGLAAQDGSRPAVQAALAGSAQWALEFDGLDDFVRLAETELMFGGPGWAATKTVSLWVKPLGNGECLHPDVGWCDHVFGDRPRWWGISHGPIHGENRLWVWNRDADGIDTIGIPYVPGEWVHVTLVHSGGELRAYRNGRAAGSRASGDTAQPETGAHPVLHLGGVIIGDGRMWTFQGQLDEVQLWSTALTPAEVQATMQQTVPRGTPDLAAYYQMSDGAGLTLTDDTGYGWDGVLTEGGPGVPSNGRPPQWVDSDAFDPLPNFDLFLPALPG